MTEPFSLFTMLMEPGNQPAWVNAPGHHSDRALLRRKWLFKLAALYATEDGSLNALAREIGRSESTIHVLLANDRPGHEVCKAIEELVGAHVFNRYWGMYGE